MSNNYAGYFRDSIRPDSESEVARLLYTKQALAYPHVTASEFDLPNHALRYAAGLKPVNLKPLVDSRMFPEYKAAGRPVSACCHQDLAAHRVVRVSTDSEVGHHLSNYVRPERETSVTGAV